MPVVESVTEVSVGETVQKEVADGSIWDDFSSNLHEIKKFGLMWLSILVEQLRSDGKITTVAPLWGTVSHYSLQNSAVQRLGKIGEVALVSILFDTINNM